MLQLSTIQAHAAGCQTVFLTMTLGKKVIVEDGNGEGEARGEIVGAESAGAGAGRCTGNRLCTCRSDDAPVHRSLLCLVVHRKSPTPPHMCTVRGMLHCLLSSFYLST